MIQGAGRGGLAATFKSPAKKQKLCKKFTFGAKKACYTEKFTVAKIPTPRPTPKPTPPSGKIETLRKCLTQIATQLVRHVPYVFKYRHAPDGKAGYQIADGGFDMFDGGNRLYIKDLQNRWNAGNGLSYTNQCNSGWRNTGMGDIKYFTCLKKIRSPGSGDVFFAGFKSARKEITGFQTLGNLGADNVKGSKIVLNHGIHLPRMKMWVYRKSIVPGPRKTGQKDPSNNHLIFVPASWNHYWPRPGLNKPPQGGHRDIRRRRAYTTDFDYHAVEGGSRVNQLFYVMWGGHTGQWHYEYNQGYINNAIRAVKPCNR